MGKKVDRIELVCYNCGKKYKLIPWMYRQKLKRKTKNTYCSNKCRDKAEVGENSPAWKGGRQKHGRYIKINIGKNKREFEHRLVMEKEIGRKLKKGEVIHHINGDTKDNRLENLVLCVSPGYHSEKYHTKKRKVSGCFGI